MTSFSRGMAAVAAMGLCLLLAGCPDKRQLGESCLSDSECETGFCYGQCLEPDLDNDGDGVLNKDEKLHESDPLDPDSDGDGVDDGTEYGDPRSPRDTDDDGLIDAIEDSGNDEDGDCLFDQEDPQNETPNPELIDLDKLSGLCVAVVTGVCADDVSAIAVSCTVNDEGELEPVCNTQFVSGYTPNDICGNNLDDDCDSLTDEPDCDPPTGCAVDTDGDGICDDDDPDDDNDGVLDADDCRPLDDTIYPGAPELCNGIDDNCDGTDPGGSTVVQGAGEVFVREGPDGDGTPQNPFGSVAAALASDATTIYVAQGSYRGPHTVDRDVTVLGSWDCDWEVQSLENTTSELSGNGGAAVEVTGGTLTARSMRFEGDNNGTLGIAAAALVDGAGSTLDCIDCEFKGGSNGPDESWAALVQGGTLQASDTRFSTGSGVVQSGGLRIVGGVVTLDRSEVSVSEAPSPHIGLDISGDAMVRIEDSEVDISGEDHDGYGIVLAEQASLLAVNNELRLQSQIPNDKERILVEVTSTGSTLLVNNAMRVSGPGSIAATLRSAGTPGPVSMANNLLEVSDDVGERTSIVAATAPDLFHNNFGGSPSNGLLLLPEGTFGLAAINGCLFPGCDPGKVASNWALECPFNNGTLPVGSPCRDKGVEPTFVGFPADPVYGVDKLGTPRADGFWDIGPIELVGDTATCTEDADCGSDPCVYNFCANGSCAFPPAIGSEDLDGDGSCNAVDNDADGDGFDGSVSDCNDLDPTIYPGAAEVCDGIDQDCLGGSDITSPYLEGEAIFVVAGAAPGGNGSRATPYADITEALGDANVTTRPVLVTSGVFATPLNIDSNVAPSGTKVTIIGSFSDCDFLPLAPGAPATTLIQVNSAIGALINGAEVEFQNIEFSAGAGADTHGFLLQDANVTLRNGKIGLQPGAPGANGRGVQAAGASSLLLEDVVVSVPPGYDNAFGISMTGATSVARLERTILDVAGPNAMDAAGVIVDGELELFNTAVTVEANGASNDVLGVRAGGRATIVNSLVAVGLPGGNDTMGIILDSITGEVGTLLNTVVSVPPPAGGNPTVALVLDDSSGAPFNLYNNAIGPSADLAATIGAVPYPTIADLEGCEGLGTCTVSAGSNLPIDCVSGAGPPDFLLDSASLCLDAGVDPAAFVGDPATGFDISGQPRTGDWDIGPSQGVFTGSVECVADADCTNPPGQECYDAVCDGVGFCQYTLGPDLDGDFICDLDDPDIDGDLIENGSDCAPLDPSTYPGAPEACFDNVINDCDASNGGDPQADPTAAVYVALWGSAGALGTPDDPVDTIEEAISISQGQFDPPAPIHIAVGEYLPAGGQGISIQSSESHTLVGGFDGCDWAPTAERPVIKADRFALRTNGGATVVVNNVSLATTGGECPNGSIAGAVAEANSSMTLVDVDITTDDAPGPCDNIGIRIPLNNATVDLDRVSITTGFGQQGNKGIWLNGNSSLTVANSEIRPEASDGSVNGIRIDGGTTEVVIDNTVILHEHGSTPTAAQTGIYINADGVVPVITDSMVVMDPGTNANDVIAIHVHDGGADILNSFLNPRSPVGNAAVGVRFDGQADNGPHQLVNTVIRTEAPVGFSHGIDVIGGFGGTISIRNNAISSAGGTFAALFDGQPRSLADINGGNCGAIASCAAGSGNNIPDNCPMSPGGYLPSDSPCVDAGSQLSFITYPTLNEDFQGDSRPQGPAWDIGPDEVRSCTDAADCGAADPCVTATCPAGLCNIVGPVDTDGNGECDALDPDDDGDGVADVDDPCPNTPEFGADKDGDGCDTIQDCIDENPDIYPGAPEIACDGVINDCNAAGGGGTTAVQGDVYVDANFGGVPDGTVLAPYPSIQQALESIATAGGVVVVGVGSYSEALELDSGGIVPFQEFLTFEVRGRADASCGFEPATGGEATTISSPADVVVYHEVNSELHLTDLTLTHSAAASTLPSLTGVDHDSSALVRLNRVTVQTGDNSGTGSVNKGISVNAGGPLEVVESIIDVGPCSANEGISATAGLLLSQSTVRVPGTIAGAVNGLSVGSNGLYQIVDSVVEVGYDGKLAGSVVGLNAQTRVEMVNSIVDVRGQSSTTQNGIGGFGAEFDIVGSAIQLADDASGYAINHESFVGSYTTRLVNSIVVAPSGTGVRMSNPGNYDVVVANSAIDAMTLVDASGQVSTVGDLNACLWASCNDSFSGDNLGDSCRLFGPDYALAPDSPCGGSGINPELVAMSLINQGLDRDGEARPLGDNWDIGPDEVVEVVPPDSDNDGVLDAFDSCPNGAPTGVDADGDGCMEGPEDCNDQSPLVNNGPNQVDTPCDGIDQDCSDGGFTWGAGTANVVFVDPGAPTNGDGAIDTPFNILVDAVTATMAAGQDHVIVVREGQLQFGAAEAIDIAAATHGGVNSLTILGGRDAFDCEWGKSVPEARTDLTFSSQNPLPALTMGISAPVVVDSFTFNTTIYNGDAVSITQSSGSLELRNVHANLAGDTFLGAGNGSMIAFQQTGGQAVLDHVELAPSGASENLSESIGVSSSNGDLEIRDSIIKLEDVSVASDTAVGVRIHRTVPLVIPIIDSTMIRVASLVDGAATGVELTGDQGRLFMVNSISDVTIDFSSNATDVRGIWAHPDAGSAMQLDIVHSGVVVFPEGSVTNIAIHQDSDAPTAATHVFNSLIDILGGQGVVVATPATTNISVSHNYINAAVPLFAAGAAQAIDNCAFSGAISPCGDNFDQNVPLPCALSGPYQYALLPGTQCQGAGLDLVGTGEYIGVFAELIGTDFEDQERPGGDLLIDIGPDEALAIPCANNSACNDFNPCTLDTCDAAGTGTCNPPLPVPPAPGYYVDLGAPPGGNGEATSPFQTIDEALTAIDIDNVSDATIYLGPSDQGGIDLNPTAYPSLNNLTILGGYNVGCTWERLTPDDKTRLVVGDGPALALQGINLILENVILESAFTFNPVKVVDVQGGTLMATKTEVAAQLFGSAGSIITGVAVSGGQVSFIDSRIAPEAAENVAGVMVTGDSDVELVRTEIAIAPGFFASMNAIGVLAEQDAAPTNPVRIIESVIRMTNELSAFGYGVQTKGSGRVLILNSVVEVAPLTGSFFTSAAAVGVGDAGDPLSDGQAIIANSALLMPDTSISGGQRAVLELQNQAMGEAAKLYNAFLSAEGTAYGIYVGNLTPQVNEYGATHSYIDAQITLWAGASNSVDDLNACTGTFPANCLQVPSGNNFSASGGACSLSPYPDYQLGTGSPCQDAGTVLTSAQVPAPWDGAVQGDRNGAPRCDAPGGGVWDVGPSEAPCP